MCKQPEDSSSEKTPQLTVRKAKNPMTEESSDDEIGSESPLDEIPIAPEFDNSAGEVGVGFPPTSLVLRDHPTQMMSSARSDTRFVLCIFLVSILFVMNEDLM